MKRTITAVLLTVAAVLAHPGVALAADSWK
jgi:hypothetical protein